MVPPSEIVVATAPLAPFTTTTLHPSRFVPGRPETSTKPKPLSDPTASYRNSEISAACAAGDALPSAAHRTRERSKRVVIETSSHSSGVVGC